MLNIGPSMQMKNMVTRSFFKSQQAGFTLIEMLITVSIVLVLVALCFPAWGKIKDSSIRSKDASNLRSQAAAVLAYASDHENTLPGRINRGIAIPSAVTDTAKRTYYLSTVLIDSGYAPNDDGIWRSAVDYGVNASGVAYVVNSGKSSIPTYFFGNRSNTAGATTYEPKRLVSLKSNLDPTKVDGGKDEEPMSKIWMISNADGENYSSSTTGGLSNSVPDGVRTPWDGRNYVFFDGHVEFIKRGNYPSAN